MRRIGLTMLFIAVTLSGFAQYTLRGTVTDRKNGEPLAGATVVLKGEERGTIAQDDGSFRIGNVAQGSYLLNVTYVGYETHARSIEVDHDMTFEIEMKRALIYADEVIVSATRADEQTPTTFSKVSKEEIEKSNLGQDLPYMLQTSPSVLVTSDAGAGVGYTYMRIRGSDQTRINVTLNGIPLNDSESHGVFWVDLPDFASSVENIQIQRGVGTSTNGAGAFGATVNVQTNTLNEEPYAEINNSFGSFATRKHTVSAGTGLIEDKFAFDARLSKVSSDGYVDRASSDLQSYFVSGGYYGDKHYLKVNIFSGYEQTYQAWYGTPESKLYGSEADQIAYADRNGLTPAQRQNFLNSGRTYNFYTYENETDNYWQDHYQVFYGVNLSRDLNFNVGLHYTHGEGYFEQFREEDALANYGLDNITLGDSTITASDIIRRRWLNNDFYGFTFSSDYNPNERLTLTLGGAWNNYDGNHYGEIIWARFAGDSEIRDRYYDNDANKKDFNVFLKANYQLLDNVNVFADAQVRSIRYKYAGIDNDQREILGDHSYNFFNPKFGVTYTLDSRSNVYASYAVAHREPIRADFIDAPTDAIPSPEELRNIEAGYRSNSENHAFQANFYYMGYTNQLVPTGRLNDVGASLRENVDDSYRTGIEVNGTYRISPQFDVSANATYSQNKIASFDEVLYDYVEGGVEENSYSNTDIAYSPEWMGNLVATYRPVEQLELSWTSQYVGKQYLDNTSNEDRIIRPYFINDLRAIYTIQPNFMNEIVINATLYNVFNELYESNGYTFSYLLGDELVTENFYYPQATRHFMVGLSMKF